MMAASIWDEWDRMHGWAYRPPSGFETEAQWVDYLRVELSSDFYVYSTPQLMGRLCTGRRVRADLVLAPKAPWGGRLGTSQAPITLEVKRRFDVGDVTKALGQAADYAHAVWDVVPLIDKGFPDVPENGRMMSCVMYDDRAYHSNPNGEMWLDRIAGALNVMVLSHSKWQGWRISNSGAGQWSQRDGMSETKFQARVKEGSR